jgi:hypothetical protein
VCSQAEPGNKYYSAAAEEAELLGSIFPGRGNLGKSNRVERGQDACRNIHNYSISGGFLQENFFGIFLSPCGIVVYRAKYFLDAPWKRRGSAGVLVLS